jgi:hypothetical protein
MQYLNNITDDPDQLMLVQLGGGNTVQLELIYRPAVQRWTMNLWYPNPATPSLQLMGNGLCVHPNLVRAWKNLIPFGLAISSLFDVGPVNITDFQDGTASLYVLSAAEVQMVEQQILGRIPLVVA